MINLIEIFAAAENDDGIFDQLCKYGYRVGMHAVYCHNEEWKDAPRKCQRTWYWGNGATWEHQDQSCPGFKPNKEGSK